MIEKALLLGKDRSLVGILTLPNSDINVVDRPGILFLNSGLLHRVGPNRIYVKMARKFAMQGFPVLRFDLSGIGDSRISHNHEKFDESTGIIKDTQEVMDYLYDSFGIQKFILMGFCSGGSNAFQVAVHDERVQGINLIEGFAFPSSGYFVKSYSKSLLSPRSWWRLLTGKSELWGLLKGILKFYTSVQTRQLTENLQFPEKEQLLTNLETLIHRGVKIIFIYSADSSAYYNYRKIFEQTVNKLPLNNRPQVEVINNTDHLFTLFYHQELLISLILDWLEKNGLTQSDKGNYVNEQQQLDSFPHTKTSS